MKITVLMENTPYAEGFQAEHGLSLLIETGGRRILFDTGQTDGFAANAEKLDADLSTVDYAVLSHGHYDHSGGLVKFLSLNRHAPVYVQRHVFDRHTAEGGRDIGVDASLADHPQIVRVDEQSKIDDLAELCSCNDRPRPFHMDSYGLFAQRLGATEPDLFLHEQYLILTEGGRKFVFSGCSHKGILNIMHWLTPDVLVGGFHFMKVDMEGPEKRVLDEAAQTLMRYPAQYYTCHCTGLPQYAYLKSLMGHQLDYLASGRVLDLGEEPDRR